MEKRFIHWHFVLIVLGTCMLAACAVTPAQQHVPASAPIATYPNNLHGARLYQVDAQASSVHILVYRGGTMARMGHNHVISAANFSGYVWRGITVDNSGFYIVVPVNALIVDDDAARTTEGTDFPLNVSDAARQGTQTNMVSEALLDSAHYPAITLKAIAMTGTIYAPRVRVAMQVKDHTREVTVPVTIEASDTQLAVRGEFKVKQSDFGITPFSVAMGALVVVDSVTIKFNLVARHTDP